MRRLALISGMLLTLTAGVWGSALAAFSVCLHETGAVAAPASDAHDCCRARLGASPAPHSEHSESPGHAHAETKTPARASSPSQADGSRERSAHADCEAGEAGERESQSAAAAFGDGGRSCLECCAGGSDQVPTTASIGAPEPHKVKRAAPDTSACACDSFAPAAPGVAHLAPSQHAPPAPGERRHMLISVFLI